MIRRGPNAHRTYKGAYRTGPNSYRAVINVGYRKQRYLGTFKTPGEAAFRYDQEAYRLYGADCFLNFPERIHEHQAGTTFTGRTAIERAIASQPRPSVVERLLAFVGWGA